MNYQYIRILIVLPIILLAYPILSMEQDNNKLAPENTNKWLGDVAFRNNSDELFATNQKYMFIFNISENRFKKVPLCEQYLSAFSTSHSPDNEQVAVSYSCNRSTIKIFSLKDNKFINTWPWEQNNFFHQTCYIDNDRLIVGGLDGTVKILYTKTGKQELFYEDNINDKDLKRITGIAYHRNKNKLVFGNRNAQIKLWDMNTNKQLTTLAGYKRNSLLAFDSNGTKLVSAAACDLCQHDANRDVALWDLERSTCIATVDSKRNGITTMAYRPDDKQIATAHLPKYTITLLDPKTSQEIGTLQYKKNQDHLSHWSISYSPDSTLLAASSDDGILIYDLRKADQHKIIFNETYEKAILMTNGNHIPGEKMVEENDFLSQ